jgi:hypothetical protein
MNLSLRPIPMKTRTRLAALIAAASSIVVGAASATASDPGWTDLLNTPGQSHRAAIIDPFSNDPQAADLVLAGDVHGVQSGLLHRFSQSASSLTPLDTDTSNFGTYGLAWDTSPSSAGFGNLYRVGTVQRSTASGNLVPEWTVLRGTEATTQWSPSATFRLADAWSEARGVTVDDAGNLHVCGMALDAAGVGHWVVARSQDQGASWTYTSVFQGSGAYSFTGYNHVAALGITFVPSTTGPGGALFAVGTRGKLYAGAWTVTRSSDGGASWQVVDTEAWLPRKANTSRARKVAADSAGRIFVLGDTGSRMENAPSPWVIRMSSNGGTSWTTIFGPWNYGPCPYPIDLAVDALGNVWAVGVTHEKYGTKKVTYTSRATWVRLTESAPGNGVWSSSYGFLTDEAQGINRAAAEAITVDAAGRIYISGSYRANDGSPWVWFAKRYEP